MAGETEELWFPSWEFAGWPWKSPLYAKWNPMLFAENFKTPTLVVTSGCRSAVDVVAARRRAFEKAVGHQ